MTKYTTFVLLIFLWLVMIPSGQAQPLLPATQGRILYHYTGNTEGYREHFFRDSGNEQALYTNLIRSSTFYAIATNTPENTVEYFKENTHFHFDLDQKKGQILKVPFGLLEKYIPLSEGSGSIREALESKGAKHLGQVSFQNKTCDRWQYRDREFLLWEGLLMKLISSGFNKNFSMEVVDMDLQGPVPEEKFNFPAGIPVD